MIDLIAVDSSYRHVSKIASPGPLLRAGASRLKWYDVARADTPVPSDIREMARSFLVSEAQKGTLELDRDVGFAVLHRCGAGNDLDQRTAPSLPTTVTVTVSHAPPFIVTDSTAASPSTDASR